MASYYVVAAYACFVTLYISHGQKMEWVKERKRGRDYWSKGGKSSKAVKIVKVAQEINT